MSVISVGTIVDAVKLPPPGRCDTIKMSRRELFAQLALPILMEFESSAIPDHGNDLRTQEQQPDEGKKDEPFLPQSGKSKNRKRGVSKYGTDKTAVDNPPDDGLGIPFSNPGHPPHGHRHHEEQPRTHCQDV